MSTDRPTVLRKLRLDEFSFVTAPASVGSDVLVWKRDEAGMTGAERVAKAVEDKANAAVDEAMALLDEYARTRVRATFDKADAVLRRSPEVAEAYRHRTAYGERWTAPVAKAEVDHKPAVLRLVKSRDWKGLEALGKAHPESARAYDELMFSGAFDDPPPQAA